MQRNDHGVQRGDTYPIRVDRLGTSRRVALPAGSQETYTLEKTLVRTGIGRTRLARYELAHIVTPIRIGRHRHFQASDLTRIRKAHRMERDLGINLPGIEVILRLTDQIEEMQLRLAAYETQSRVRSPRT